MTGLTNEDLLEASAKAMGYVKPNRELTRLLPNYFWCDDEEGKSFPFAWDPINSALDLYRLMRHLKLRIDFKERTVSYTSDDVQIKSFFAEGAEAEAVLYIAYRLVTRKEVI